MWWQTNSNLLKEVKNLVCCVTLVYNKKLKFRTLFKVPKNLNMCPDVSGLCPSSVECSLTNIPLMKGTVPKRLDTCLNFLAL